MWQTGCQKAEWQSAREITKLSNCLIYQAWVEITNHEIFSSAEAILAKKVQRHVSPSTRQGRDTRCVTQDVGYAKPLAQSVNQCWASLLGVKSRYFPVNPLTRGVRGNRASLHGSTSWRN